jgi:acid phosphatase (class A)
MNLDDIKYGNPAKEHKDSVEADKAGILRACMDKGIIKDIIENHPFPANSSDETKNELEYLTKITNNADEDDIRFCKLIETNHYDFFVIVAKKLGLDVSKEEILKWVGDIDPITFYLKDKFNRPRPYQLAKELGLDLHPITATDANSAAYPSGHTMDFLVILYHFGKMNPALAEELDDFYHEIKRARELSGLHYPSDRKVSEYIFKQLVKHNLIK